MGFELTPEDLAACLGKMSGAKVEVAEAPATEQPAKAEPEPRGGTWLAACPRGKVDLCRVPGPHSFDRCA